MGAQVGQLVRDDIIPPGIYWVDSFEATSIAQQAARESYLKVFSDYIRTIRTEHVEANQGGPAYDWLLFEVLKPTPRWPTITGWGFPTRASRGADTTRADTVQRPPPEPDILDRLNPDQIPTWVWVAGVGFAGLLVYAAVRR